MDYYFKGKKQSFALLFLFKRRPSRGKLLRVKKEKVIPVEYKRGRTGKIDSRNDNERKISFNRNLLKLLKILFSVRKKKKGFILTHSCEMLLYSS